MTAPLRPSVGDHLVVRDNPTGRAGATRPHDVRVVSVGPKYVHVIESGRYDGYEPTRDRWRVRKFLLADGKEGAAGTRVGYAASIATVVQYGQAERQRAARRYLFDQGVDLRPTSPWWGREPELAEVLKRAVDA
jgi:hypothetical protein